MDQESNTNANCGCTQRSEGSTSAANSGSGQDEATVFDVINMDCRNEEAVVRRALEGRPGIERLEFDLPHRRLTVVHKNISAETIETALQAVGMNASRTDEPATQADMQAGPEVRTAELRSPANATAALGKTTSRVTYRIENMDCPTEEALIRDRLGKEPGIAALDFNLVQRTLSVRHSLASPETIERALQSIGMKALPHRQQSVTTVLHIAKMDCPTEEALIRGKLGSMVGVDELDFNLLQHTLTVRHSPEVASTVVGAIESLGMQARVQSTDEPRDVQQPHETNWWPLAVSGVAAALAEAVHWANGGTHWTVIALALLSVFTGGLDTYKKGWIAVRNRNLNMNALMSIAVTGGMAIGAWPEAAMVMFLFALAEVIEAKSLDRARNAIRGLLELAPESATVRQPDGSWKDTPAMEVGVGAIVRVRPGERIALDGVVTNGRSAVNQAPITGESLPVEKAEGDPVFAGTINETGSFEYRASTVASHSTLARIIHAVESAQGSRAPTQRFVDRFARVYTPLVFIVALLVATVPPLVLAGAWLDWIYKALVLLVIACPCALVISTPVTIVSGLAAAARRGILIKGGVYLEGGRKLKVLALDKTGTLTHGKPEQTEFVALKGMPADVESWAASLAARSDHPVSQAIARNARSEGVAVMDVADFAALPGRGVRGKLAGKELHLGNHRLVIERGLGDPALQSQLEALEHKGNTAVVLMDDRSVLGIFAVADTVKETSRHALAELAALGVRTLMLTGDNQHTANAIAEQVGIREARGDQLPEDKLKTIEGLVSADGQVGMVGDGINDSPALARADIGFAMGAAGTDTAIETADVALMDDDLRKIPAFIRLSRTTASILRQNIVLALGIKAVFLVLTFTGQATMWMAVFADMGASLIVVFNGLRLLKLKTA